MYGCKLQSGIGKFTCWNGAHTCQPYFVHNGQNMRGNCAWGYSREHELKRGACKLLTPLKSFISWRKTSIFYYFVRWPILKFCTLRAIIKICLLIFSFKKKLAIQIFFIICQLIGFSSRKTMGHRAYFPDMWIGHFWRTFLHVCYHSNWLDAPETNRIWKNKH